MLSDQSVVVSQHHVDSALQRVEPFSSTSCRRSRYRCHHWVAAATRRDWSHRRWLVHSTKGDISAILDFPRELEQLILLTIHSQLQPSQLVSEFSDLALQHTFTIRAAGAHARTLCKLLGGSSAASQPHNQRRHLWRRSHSKSTKGPIHSPMQIPPSSTNQGKLSGVSKPLQLKYGTTGSSGVSRVRSRANWTNKPERTPEAEPMATGLSIQGAWPRKPAGIHISETWAHIYCILSYCTVLDLPTARIYHPFKIQQKEELKHSTLPLWQPYLSSLIFVTTHAAWNCNFHSAHASKTKPRDPVPQPNEKTDSLTDWFATRPMFDESPQDPMEPEFLNQHSPECIACSYSIWAAAGHACLYCILHLSLGPPPPHLQSTSDRRH